MAFQRVPDTAEVSLVYGYGTGPDIQNSFYMRNPTLERGVEYCSDLADAFQAWWDANVQPIQVDDITLREIRVVDLDGQFGARFVKTVGLTGSSVNTPAPGAVAAIVHFECDPGSAPRKGTIFHPGLQEAQIDVDGITGAAVTAIQAAYDTVREGADVDPADALVAVSRYSGYTIVERPNGTSRKKPTQRNPALTNTIASVVVPSRYGVQKRRRPSPL